MNPIFARPLGRHILVWSLLVGSLGCVPLRAVSTSAPTLRPFEIRDLLKLVAVGKAVGFGRQIVWEQSPPYDEIGYYGFGHIGAWRETGFQLRTLAWDGGEPVVRPLFAPERGVSYWLGPVSPRESAIAFYAAKNGTFFTGAFDARANRVVQFPVTPEVAPMIGWEARWISEDELIFPACIDGRQPLLAARAYTGMRRGEAWARTWAGGVAVDVADSSAPLAEAPWLPGRLYRANIRTGVAEVFADGAYASLSVSPDGRYLAALREGPLGTGTAAPPQGDWVWTRTQLVVFDLRRGGEPTIVADGKEVMKGSLTWAFAADRLAFFAWQPGQGVRAGQFWSWNADSGALQSHPHAGLDLASARERGWSQLPEQPVWLGDELAVCARAHGGKEARFTYRDTAPPGAAGAAGKPDWFLLRAQGPLNLTAPFKSVSATPVHVDERGLAVLADGAVWRVGPKTAPVNLTPGLAAQLEWPMTSTATRFVQRGRFSGQALLQLVQDGVPSLVLVDAVEEKLHCIPFGKATDVPMAVSVASGAAMFCVQVPTGTELVVKNTHGLVSQVERLNRHLAEVALTRWQTVSYAVQTPAGERSVRGRLLLPPDYQPGRRYPMIVEVYPGVSHQASESVYEMYNGIASGASSYSEHIFAGKGYAVFFPSAPTELIRNERGPLGGMTAIVEQGIDAVIRQGFADPDRIALFGVSQGGFSSLWVATESRRFKAVVSLNGWVDMYSHYFESTYLADFVRTGASFRGNPVRYEPKTGGDFNIGSSPYDAPDAYVKSSPLFRAPEINAPTLLIHSDFDTFALSHYERFFTALTLLHKRAQLLRYWGEGHTPSSPGNIRDLNSRILAWLDDNCDISRDERGRVRWNGNTVRSLQGAPASTPADFLRIEDH